MKKTTEIFKKEISDMYGDEYSLKGEYGKSNKEHVTIVHNTCGSEYKTTPNTFLRGCKCPNCSRNKKIDLPTALDRLKKKKIGYTFMGDYTGYQEDTVFIHSCGTEFKTSFFKLLKGDSACPNCSKTKKLSPEKFSEKICKLTNNEFLVIDDYINTNTKIRFKHNIESCMKEFKTRPSDFIRYGCNCPICKESKGERIIAAFLSDHNIPYKRQYTYNDCKNIRVLPFDFLINNSILVEYDGEQHFSNIYGEDSLNQQIERDNIKNNYCTEHMIKLLRIPFFEQERIDYFLLDMLKNNVVNMNYTDFSKWVEGLKIKKYKI